MGKRRRTVARGWKWLWCIPQASREQVAGEDWNHLELTAIGSAWGRDRTSMLGSGVGARADDWSSTIIAELTR